MASVRWIIHISIIAYLSTLAPAKQASNQQLEKVFIVSEDEQLIIDDRSLRDDHFVYASCAFQSDNTSMNCTLVLNHIYKSSISNKTCQITRKTGDKSNRIEKDNIQLKYLFGNDVAFAWSELGAARIPYATVRKLNMTDCKFRDTTIPYITASRRELHIVPYADTFDLFYRNVSVCGVNFMCGQTIDAKGRVLNGPVPSYLNRTYFEQHAYIAIGTLEHKSSKFGHFLLTNEARIVSAYGGKNILLSGDPSDADYKTFSMEHGKLGLCYISKVRKHLTCVQYDRRGNTSLTFSQNLDYVPGPRMAMYNLPKGGILLATSQCDEEKWCKDNIDRVPFKFVKIQTDGSVDDVFTFKGVNCNGSDEVYMNVKGVTKDNAGVSVVCCVNKSPSEVNVNVAHYYVSI